MPDSFFVNQYDDEALDDPVVPYQGTSLIAPLNPVRPKETFFLRFSNASLTSDLRFAATQAAGQMVDHLYENQYDAYTFRPADIGARVGHLLSSGIAVI